MRQRRSLLIGVLVILVPLVTAASGCGTAASAEVPLKHSYDAGDSWTYEMTMVINGSVTGPGMPESDAGVIPQDTTMKIRETITVSDVTNGVATLSAKTEILEASADGQPMPTGAEASQEVTMQVDEAGKVLAIEGPDTAEAAAGFFESGMPFDPSQFSNQLGVLLPEGGLGKVGDEWSDTSTFPIPGMGEDITANTKARFVSLAAENGREIATIDYSIEVPLDLELDLGAMLQDLGGQMGASDMSGLKFKMTISGKLTFTGTAKVDTADGQTAAMNGTLDMTMDMEITEAPDGTIPSDQRGPFALDMEATIYMLQK